MPDREVFGQDMRRIWADHFGCPAELPDQPGTTIIPEAKYAGDKSVALWRIGARVFALGLGFRQFFSSESLRLR